MRGYEISFIVLEVILRTCCSIFECEYDTASKHLIIIASMNMLTIVALVCDRPRPRSLAPQTTTRSDCFIPTHGGTAGDSVCIFPFDYRGVTYYGCTTVDNNGDPWCYTSYDYKNDHLWSNCFGMSALTKCTNFEAVSTAVKHEYLEGLRLLSETTPGYYHGI